METVGTSAWVVETILRAIAALLYARWSVTSNEDYEYAAARAFQPWALDKLRAAGPVSAFNPNVLWLAGLLTAPWLFAPILVGTTVHDFMIVLSIGALLSPLTLPTSLGPKRDDLIRPGVALVKWLSATFDVWVKTFLLIGIFSVLAWIPILSDIFRVWTKIAFPMLGDEITTQFLESALGGTLSVYVLMFVVRYLMSVAHRWHNLFVTALSTAWLWTTTQYSLEQHFLPAGAAPNVLSGSLIALICITVVSEVIPLVFPTSRTKRIH